MFVTTTVAGALPVGVIISDCEKQEVFAQALSSLINLFQQAVFTEKRQFLRFWCTKCHYDG